jgi:hypothetical protein
VDALVAQLLRGAEHRLDDEGRRRLARDAEQDAGLDHRLGEQCEVRRARAGERRDRVHRVLRYADDAAEMSERFLGEREMLLARVRAGAEAGHSLVHHRRRVGHRANDGHAVRNAGLDLPCGDRRRDGENRLLGSEQRPDLLEQRVDVLWLDGDDDERGAADGVGIRGGRLDAVARSELGGALLAPARNDDVGPARGEQAGEQRLADPAPAEDCQPSLRHARSLPMQPAARRSE